MCLTSACMEALVVSTEVDVVCFCIPRGITEPNRKLDQACQLSNAPQIRVI
jgi:hypothetical protein